MPAAVVLDVVEGLGALAEGLARGDDRVVALAHRLGGEVGVRARAVPVALDRLGVEGRGDAEVLGGAVEQPAGDPQVVGDLQRGDRADLELPLAGHDLGVDAGDRETGLEAVLQVGLDDLAAEDLVGADTAVVAALGAGKPPSGKPSGRAPSKKVYSCSMPKIGSCAAYFSDTSTSAARVLDSCGVMSISRTSHMTRMSSPPRIGSGKLATGLSTRSEECPSAWFVDDPSKPQIGSSAPLASSARIFVLERSLAVGWVPSIQMYSALKVTGHILRGGSFVALAGAAAQRHWSAAIHAAQPVNMRFPDHCPSVNPVLPGGAVSRFTCAAHGAP